MHHIFVFQRALLCPTASILYCECKCRILEVTKRDYWTKNICTTCSVSLSHHLFLSFDIDRLLLIFFGVFSSFVDALFALLAVDRAPDVLFSVTRARVTFFCTSSSSSDSSIIAHSASFCSSVGSARTAATLQLVEDSNHRTYPVASVVIVGACVVDLSFVGQFRYNTKRISCTNVREAAIIRSDMNRRERTVPLLAQSSVS